MRFNRKVVACFVALAGIALAAASTAEAQLCQHIGNWSRIDGRWVCSGEYTSGLCVWYDDCRKSAE